MSLQAPRLEPVHACPVCGSGRSRELFWAPDRLFDVPGVFRYVECEACHTVFQSPRVVEEDLPACYPAGYYTHEADEKWSPTPAPPGSLRDRVRRAIRAADGAPESNLSTTLRFSGAVLAAIPGLRRRARFGLVDGLEPPAGGGGRCLEVGPGGGLDLLRLRLLGWLAEGLEIDPVSAERARRTSGCEVRVGTLATAGYPAGCFDLVYMSHVFEHLASPTRALEQCFELLGPSGRLVLVYPNPRAFSVRRFGSCSCVFEPPGTSFFLRPRRRRRSWEGPASRTFGRRRRRAMRWSTSPRRGAFARATGGTGAARGNPLSRIASSGRPSAPSWRSAVPSARR